MPFFVAQATFISRTKVLFYLHFLQEFFVKIFADLGKRVGKVENLLLGRNSQPPTF